MPNAKHNGTKEQVSLTQGLLQLLFIVEFNAIFVTLS